MNNLPKLNEVFINTGIISKSEILNPSFFNKNKNRQPDEVYLKVGDNKYCNLSDIYCFFHKKRGYFSIKLFNDYETIIDRINNCINGAYDMDETLKVALESVWRFSYSNKHIKTEPQIYKLLQYMLYLDDKRNKDYEYVIDYTMMVAYYVKAIHKNEVVFALEDVRDFEKLDVRNVNSINGCLNHAYNLYEIIQHKS